MRPIPRHRAATSFGDGRWLRFGYGRAVAVTYEDEFRLSMVGGRLRSHQARVFRRPRRDLTDEICGPRQRTSTPEGDRRNRGLRVREPRLVALTGEEEREAVVLLADLLGAAAAKRRPGVSVGALDGVSVGVFSGATDHAEMAARAGGAE